MGNEKFIIFYPFFLSYSAELSLFFKRKRTHKRSILDYQIKEELKKKYSIKLATAISI